MPGLVVQNGKNVLLTGCGGCSQAGEALILLIEDDLSEVMVRMLCNELPAQEAALFWLRHMEGYNSTELGEMFNLAPSTVRTKLACARGRLVKLYFESIRKGEY